MKKYYNNVSLHSRFVNFSFRFTDAKKNYSTEDNIKKFIKHYQQIKTNYKEYDKCNLVKSNISGNDVYYFNGSNSEIKDKIIIYIHGGSFVEEAISYQIKFAQKIAIKTNSTLIIPRYKLIPDGNYKKMYELISEIYENIKHTNREINFLGDSSGGGFILSYAMYLRDKKDILPKNILMLSPWIDLSMENEKLKESEKLDSMSGIDGNKYCGKLWADDLSVIDPKISPIYGDLTGLPKLTIATGSYDILKPDCLRLCELLDKNSIDYNYIEYKNQGHDFGMYPTKEGNLLAEDFSNIINLVEDNSDGRK